MTVPGVTCGVTIYDRKRDVIRTCGQPAQWQIVLYGDSIFAACSRHNRRLRKAKLT